VTLPRIAQALREQQGIELDRRIMHLRDQIKDLGDYEVEVHLGPDCTAKFTVEVVAE